MLRHIAYVSIARTTVDADTLSDILESSAKNNLRDGITGVLMHHDDLFFQVLEGESPSVEECYARIQRDPRHSGMSVAMDETVEVRSFPEWRMGYVGPDEIGKHSDGALESLSDLNAPELSDEDRQGYALELARTMFEQFASG